MILQALYELAQTETLIGDPDYEYKPISWIVRLKDNGTLINIEDNRRDLNEGKSGRDGKPIKSKWLGKDESVPVQPTRTSGDFAFFLVDKAEYVLGLDTTGKRPAEKLATRSALFAERIEACARESDDEDVKAVAIFLRSIAKTSVRTTLAEDVAANDLFAFKIGEGPFVHLRPKAKKWWKKQREIGKAQGEPRFHCLITGEPVEKVELFPLIKRVPGGTTSGVALVSHNARAFESYGLDGNDNAPISRAASQAAATALNRLLDSEPLDGKGKKLSRRYIRLSSDTVVVYWSPGGDSSALDAIAGLAEGESAETVADVYRSVWRGEHQSLKDPSRFYAMTLTGTQGRAVVRDWLETSVALVIENLARHFKDLNTVRNTASARDKPQSPSIPLRMLMDCLAAPGRDAKVAAVLAAGLIRAAFRGTKYPLAILQKTLLRARVEATGNEWIDSVRRDARAALIKGVLVRNYQLEVTPDMNPQLDSKGYLLGMLLSILERLQMAALGDINASLIDKYFAAASATPLAVFPRLLKGARHHAKKAQDSKQLIERAAAFRCERLIDGIAAQLKLDLKQYPPPPEAFPARLSLTEQGLFILAYHQMRHWLHMSNEERAEWESQHSDAPRAFRWLKERDSAADLQSVT